MTSRRQFHKAALSIAALGAVRPFDSLAQYRGSGKRGRQHRPERQSGD